MRWRDSLRSFSRALVHLPAELPAEELHVLLHRVGERLLVDEDAFVLKAPHVLLDADEATVAQEAVVEEAHDEGLVIALGEGDAPVQILALADLAHDAEGGQHGASMAPALRSDELVGMGPVVLAHRLDFLLEFLEEGGDLDAAARGPVREGAAVARHVGGQLDVLVRQGHPLLLEDGAAQLFAEGPDRIAALEGGLQGPACPREVLAGILEDLPRMARHEVQLDVALAAEGGVADHLRHAEDGPLHDGARHRHKPELLPAGHRQVALLPLILVPVGGVADAAGDVRIGGAAPHELCKLTR